MHATQEDIDTFVSKFFKPSLENVSITGIIIPTENYILKIHVLIEESKIAAHNPSGIKPTKVITTDSLNNQSNLCLHKILISNNPLNFKGVREIIKREGIFNS